MSTVAVAINSARGLLNDDAAITWSDPVLLSKLGEAFRELVLELNLYGLPVIRELSSLITVSAGDTDLDTDQPSDIVEVVSVSERTSGSSDQFVLMHEMSAIPPGLTQINRLVYWAWREEIVEFVGSTADRQVSVKYKKSLSTPTTLIASIGVIMGELYLGPRIASLVLAGKDDKLSAQYNAQARGNLDKIVQMNVVGQQSLRRRRKPYWSRRLFGLGRIR